MEREGEKIPGELLANYKQKEWNYVHKITPVYE